MGDEDIKGEDGKEERRSKDWGDDGERVKCGNMVLVKVGGNRVWK